jgi:hypothetical protein
MRRTHPAIGVGNLEDIDAVGTLLIYRRRLGGHRLPIL